MDEPLDRFRVSFHRVYDIKGNMDFFHYQEIGESFPMVVNLLRDAKRCCIKNSENVLDDYVVELSDDVSVV